MWSRKWNESNSGNLFFFNGLQYKNRLKRSGLQNCKTGMKGAPELIRKMEGKQIIPKQYPDSGGRDRISSSSYSEFTQTANFFELEGMQGACKEALRK